MSREWIGCRWWKSDICPAHLTFNSSDLISCGLTHRLGGMHMLGVVMFCATVPIVMCKRYAGSALEVMGNEKI